MFELFKPAAHTQRLPSDKVDSVYSRLRWQLFIGILLAMQATIWFVRTLVWQCLT